MGRPFKFKKGLYLFLKNFIVKDVLISKNKNNKEPDSADIKNKFSNILRNTNSDFHMPKNICFSLLCVSVK